MKTSIKRVGSDEKDTLANLLEKCQIDKPYNNINK